MSPELITRAAQPLIDLALAEDLGGGDLSTDSLIPDSHQSRATIRAGAELVVCGLPLVDAVFRALHARSEPGALAEDGDAVAAGAPVWEAVLPTRLLLQGERTALNFLQMLSGMATLTARYVRAVAETGSATRICDTRKTVPGYRLLSKYAVRCGGGHNHRFSLSDAVMLKDNHLAVCDGIAAAVAQLRRTIPHTAKIEVEADRMEQAEAAVQAGADIVLLDNMSVEQVRDAVGRWGEVVTLEASGGITLDTVADYAATGVAVISVGALTHSAGAADFSMSMEAMS